MRTLLASIFCITLAGNLFSANLLLVKNGLIMSLAEGEDAPFTGYMLVDEKGRIGEVGKGSPGEKITAKTVIDAGGKFVIPGFLSGHSHPWQSVWRGIEPSGTLGEWLNGIHYKYAAHFRKGDFYAFTLHGDLDLLRHGITTRLNHTHRLSDQDLYMEQYEAEVEAGGHFIFAYVPDRKSSAENSIERLSTLMEKAEILPSPNPCLGFCLNSFGNFFGKELLAKDTLVARSLGLDLQVHYLEDPNESDSQRRRFSWFEEVNALWPGIVFGHFIHPTEEILDSTIEAGGAMIWNPLSNGRLASGLADIPHYLEKGLRVGMGVDGQASADLSDPFENMRMGLYALRMKYQDPAILRPLDVIRLHTIRTAEILHVEDEVGTLEPGKLADFLIVDPASPPTGPVFDPYGTLVLACSSSNIESIYVAGRLRVKNGSVIGHDAPALEKEVTRRIEAIKSRQKKANPDTEEDHHQSDRFGNEDT